MAVDIVIPADLWEEDMEAVITDWLVSDGAQVAEGTLVAEIMVSKTQFEIHAPATGIVTITAPRETVVTKGAVIGSVG